jgi:CubicO group peptidase (beta-lactamase class C family)
VRALVLKLLLGVGLVLGAKLLLPATGVAADSAAAAQPPLTPSLRAALGALDDSVRTGAYGELHQILVLQHGRPFYEAGLNGWNVDSLHAMYSVTKSVTALLVGIAIEQAKIDNVDAPLAELLPEYSAILRADPRKARITLADLLTMTAGFAWDERAAPYGDPRNPTSELARSDDWVRYVLERPMANEPGARFVYNSGLSIVIGAVLERATSTRVSDFAARTLFEPLKISDVHWETGARGLTNTGWGLSLRPADLAKIGTLVLQGGRWEGQAVVPRAWIDKALAEHVEVRGRRRYGYGYQWWRMQAGAVADTDGTLCFAWGFGDQFLFVVPAQDAVAVVTAGNFTNFRSMRHDPRDLLRNQLVPALRLSP